MMPIQNIRAIILITLVCVYCASRTSFKEQILLYSMKHVQALALVEPSPDLLFEGAMRGMLNVLGEELGDEYSTYISPEEEKDFLEMLDSKIEGVGIRFDPTTEKNVFKVLYPILGSPAHKAGIRLGDRILKVDGKSVEGLDMLQLSKSIRGEAGSTVVLTVVHSGEEEPVDLSIERASIQQSTVFGFEVDASGEKLGPLPRDSRIAYAYISSFNANTSREMLSLIQSFPPNVEKLILDLRDNPGGYLKAAVEVADLFVDNRGPYREIVSTKLRNGKIKPGGQYFATKSVAFHGEIIVLINGGSASAAEILAACLQDFARAKIIGERSFGKGTVQEIFELPLNSGTIKLTDASYWRPSGKNINRIRKSADSKHGKNSKISEESDDWGVSPDPGLEVKVSREQRVLVYNLRDLRIHIPSEQVESVLMRFQEILAEDSSIIHELDLEEEAEEMEGDATPEEEKTGEKSPDSIEEVEKAESKTEGEPQSPTESEKSKGFVPEGKAPYFDPVLDKAIEILQNPPPKVDSYPKEL